MASSFLDVCRFNPTAGALTDWTVSSAVTGYAVPANVGAVNGAVYSYRAESNDLSQWEVGFGAYNSSTGVLARTTVLLSSAALNAKVNFSTVPQVAIVALGEDLLAFNASMSLTDNQKAQGRANIGVEKKNYVINGAMMVSQENGSTAIGVGSSGYAVDGFQVFYNTSSGTFQAQQVAVATPGGSPYRLRYTQVTAATLTSGQAISIRFKIEGYRMADLMFGTASAKTVTLQLGLKVSLAGTYGVSFYNEAVDRVYAGQVVISSADVTAGDVVKAVTFQADTSGTWRKDNGAGLYIDFVTASHSSLQRTPSSSFGTAAGTFYTNQQTNGGVAGAVFELFDVSLSEGPVAPAFILPKFDQELLACKRYFYNGTPGAYGIMNVATSTAINRMSCAHPVTMRAAPTLTMTSALPVYDGNGVTTISALGANESTAVTLEFEATTAAALGVNKPVKIYQGAGGNLNVDARL